MMNVARNFSGKHRSAANLGITAVMALALAACSAEKSASEMTSFSSKADKGQTPGLFTIPAEQMSHVQVVTVEASNLPRVLRLTGAVSYNAFNTTPVITQVGGPVSRLLAVPGQRVKKDQALLEVSSPDYSLLFASYLKARDTFRVADKNYDRAKDLYEHHAIAERDLLSAESDRIQAQADLNASLLGLKILGIPKPEDLEKSPTAEIPLYAPIGGEIVERDVAPGQLLQAGVTQAFIISDMSSVWVLANIYQSDLADVKTGDDVTVQTDSYPDAFHGKISFISPALDPTTRTLQARIVVDNPGEKLKNNMYVTATVNAGSTRNAIAVPDASVLRDDENQPFVYVATGSDQFGRRAVEIGASQGGQTQITKGLAPGDKVVGNGAVFLQFANSFQQ
jgi:cobalt-zinc-cadmium efflux system membrane fusion protein